MAKTGEERSKEMRIVMSSIFVDDQDKALSFYTTRLGFVKKSDILLGAARWLTVVAPNDRTRVGAR
jgi:catechol 2,3-dioxygenase-like lactoylglutathione lyase family enzyme